MSEQNPFSQDAYSQNGAEIDLSNFDDEYQSAAAAEFDEVPDGKYQVRVESVRLGESSNGNAMIKWDLVVISGKFEDRHIFKNSVITQSSLPYIKGDLKTLGLELERFSDLPLYFEALLDKRLNVSKRTKGEYNNVYFNSLITEAEPVNKDEVPF